MTPTNRCVVSRRHRRWGHPERFAAHVAHATRLLVGLTFLAVLPSGRAGVEQVVVVFKTHFDLGYTDLASNVVQRYRTSMMDDALKVVAKNQALPPDQQFAWTLAGWPLSQVAGDWPGRSAERRQRILDAFHQGRFVVHALPFTLHTETLEPEDLVRGLEFASRLSRTSHLELPRDAKMTDVPCHTWELATVLHHAGVEFLHLGCNAASQSPKVPPLFWWEGPDGSRVLTMYTAASYGTGLVPPDDWPYPVWLALIHTGDNHGPPTPAEVSQLLAEAREKLPGINVRIGRLSDFSDALLARAPDVPLVRGDLPDTWIHGPQCDPAGARTARRLRPRLETVEALDTLLRLWGVPTDDITADLAQAREGSLLYGEHTWGGALWWAVKYSSGGRMPYGESWRRDRALGRFDRIESSWEEHTTYIQRASARVEPILQRQLDTLAAAVNDQGPRQVVFNPLPWRRSGLVAVPGNSSPPVWVKDVPGLGYQTTASPADRHRESQTPPNPAPPSDPFLVHGHAIENRWFRLSLDPDQARATSLVDLRTSREWIDPSARHGLGQVLLERFSADDTGAFVRDYVKINADWATNELGKPNLPSPCEAPYQALTPRQARLHYVVGTDQAEAILESPSIGPLPAVTTRWILPAHAPYLEVEVTLHDKQADPWPEALWIALPFAMTQPRFRLGRPGSIIDPASDIVRGANRHLFMVQTGVAMFESSDGPGVGICPLDSGLVSLGEPGCWKFSLEDPPRRPAVYVNLYNNQWTTNFRLWNGGTWTARVRLWTYDRYEAESCLITPSLEARYPLLMGTATGPAGKLPPDAPGLEVDRRGLLVTAFGPDPDTPAASTRLRLWELSGQGGPVQVRLPANLGAVTLEAIDLRGRKRPQSTTFPAESGGHRLPLCPFAPTTVRLRGLASDPE